eukprot:NODE_171_length_14381_cov_0.662512.p9 type:complete len:223 gc:universal NODE_171_length_14381_cov_0.662512:9706-9038(-)
MHNIYLAKNDWKQTRCADIVNGTTFRIAKRSSIMDRNRDVISFSRRMGIKQMFRPLFQKAVFVGKLSFNTTINDLQTIFPNATRVNLPKHQDGTCKGFGFAHFEKDSEADHYIENPPTLFGNQVVVDHSSSTGAFTQPPTDTLYIGNLPENVHSANVKDLFPESKNVRLLKNISGVFGFIEFESVEAAKSALDKNADLQIGEKTVRLNFSRQQRKQDQQQQQ